jgi:hypothetical protein
MSTLVIPIYFQNGFVKSIFKITQKKSIFLTIVIVAKMKWTLDSSMLFMLLFWLPLGKSLKGPQSVQGRILLNN